MGVQLTKRLYDWFFRPVDGRPLFVARAGFGAILFCAYAKYLPYFGELFGPRGINGHDTMARFPHFVGLSYQAFAKFRVLHTISSVPVIAGLYGLLMLASLAFALGFRTRPAGIVAVVLHTIFNAHNPHVYWGWAWMIIPFTWYVALSDSGRGWSADAWLAARNGGEAASSRVTISPWGMRVLQVHVCCMYAIAGLQRIGSPGWTEGEMVYRALANAGFGRFDLDWAAYRPLLVAADYFVYVLEPAAAVLLWIPRVSRWCAVLLIAMHVGLELSSDVGFWQYMMVTALMPFLPLSWFDRVAAFIKGPRDEAPRRRGERKRAAA